MTCRSGWAEEDSPVNLHIGSVGAPVPARLRLLDGKPVAMQVVAVAHTGVKRDTIPRMVGLPGAGG